MSATEMTDTRAEMARQIKQSPAVDIGKLKYWNYDACEHHDEPTPSCEYRACGGDFFMHQKIALAWIYLRTRALLADPPGAGKTNVTIGLMCMLKERGELDRRAVIVVNTPSVGQWADEFARFAPDLKVASIRPKTARPKRIEAYSSRWDVLVVGYHIALKDIDLLRTLRPGVLVTDDVDPLSTHANKVHKAIVELAAEVDYALVMNASAVSTQVSQLHANMMPLGGYGIWGTKESFEERYLNRTWETKKLKSGKTFRKATVLGLRNSEELRERLGPWVMRRGYEELNDIRMPELMPPTNVWLELHPKQRAKYEELRAGILRSASGEVRQVAALAALSYGGAVCAGLPALGEPDGPGASVKLDWLMHRITNDWTEQKIVVFAKNIGTLQALRARLATAGVGFASVWGLNNDKDQRRDDEISRFWQDDNCRVMVGTAAMERSLNLQCASIVVNVDTHLNPERMKQILGRVRRAGSRFPHVWTFTLLASDTQEGGYLKVLSRRQAVNSFIWGETEDLFPALSPNELLQLILP